MCLIPKRKTYFAQPLDVSINSPFKHALKVLWSDWFKNTPPPPSYTPSGYRRCPTYEERIGMVVKALKAVTPDVIRNAFRTCGIAPFGGDIPLVELNQRLRSVMSFDPDELISNDEPVINQWEDEIDDADSSSSYDDNGMSLDSLPRNESCLFDNEILEENCSEEDVNDDVYINDLQNEVTASDVDFLVVQRYNSQPTRKTASTARSIIKYSDV